LRSVPNEIDAGDEHRQEKKQSGICQHREPASPFKWDGKPVGKESDERVDAKNEVRAYGSTPPQKIVDEQPNG
jgi:hypothetical protein